MTDKTPRQLKSMVHNIICAIVLATATNGILLKRNNKKI
jgi:hypothetical protein